MIKKIYIASGWFNDFDKVIKSKIIEKVKSEGYEVVDPYETEVSKKFEHDLDSHTVEMANQIYEDNVRMISESDAVIFSPTTQDLGTLSDVGTGIAMGKQILQYNYFNNEIKDVTQVADSYINNKVLYKFEGRTIVEISNRDCGILLGYNYDNKNCEILYILGKGLTDNIMLNRKFTRVEKVSTNKFKSVVTTERDKVLDDKEVIFEGKYKYIRLLPNTYEELIDDSSVINLVTSVS